MFLKPAPTNEVLDWLEKSCAQSDKPDDGVTRTD
jgi:hypothetical protein